MKKRVLFAAALACLTAGVLTACGGGGGGGSSDPADYLVFTDYYGSWKVSLKEGARVENVVIPETWEGKTVDTVGSFARNTTVKTVQLPESVNSILEQAFVGCTSLESINTAKVNHIGDSAFSGCTSLKEIEISESGIKGVSILYGCTGIESITAANLGEGVYKYFSYYDTSAVPESLKNIVITNDTVFEDGVFEGCTGLQSITLPSNIRTIEWDVFADCTSLNAVYIDDLNTWLNIAFENAGANPLSHGGNLYIGGELAEHITLPEYQSGLKSYAFYGCTSLQTLTINDTYFTEGFGTDALTGCTNLTYNAKGGLNYLGTPTNDYAWIAGATDKTITSFTADESAVGIMSYAFDGCSALKEITIGESVQHFGANICGDAPVERATLAKAVYLGEGADANLKYLTLTGGTTLNGEFGSCSKLEEVTLPSTLRSLQSGAFRWCSSLKSIVIPENVVSLSSNAFDQCTSLATVEIKNPAMTVSGSGSVFGACTNLKTLIIPSLEKDAIALSSLIGNASNVETLIVKGGTSVANDACKGYFKLKSVQLPDTVTDIYGGAFSGCTGLTEFTVGENITYIGGNAFKDCTDTTFTLAYTSATWAKNSYTGNTYTWNADTVKTYLTGSSYVGVTWYKKAN